MRPACAQGRGHLFFWPLASLILSLLRRSHDALLQKAKKQALQRIDAYPAELPPPPPPWWKVGAGAGQHLLILATCPLRHPLPSTSFRLGLQAKAKNKATRAKLEKQLAKMRLDIKQLAELYSKLGFPMLAVGDIPAITNSTPTALSSAHRAPERVAAPRVSS